MIFKAKVFVPVPVLGPDATIPCKVQGEACDRGGDYFELQDFVELPAIDVDDRFAPEWVKVSQALIEAGKWWQSEVETAAVEAIYNDEVDWYVDEYL